MTRPRFVYWAHAYNGGPSHIFNRKRDAIEWGKFKFDGLFIVEPINKAKLSERLDYIKNQFDMVPTMSIKYRLHQQKG